MGPLDLQSTEKSEGLYKIFVQSLFRIVISTFCISAIYFPKYVYMYTGINIHTSMQVYTCQEGQTEEVTSLLLNACSTISFSHQ